MTDNKRYTAAVIGLGFIGGADQVSGDVLGQRVEDLDGTHVMSIRNHPRIDLVAGSSRDEGRQQRFAERFDVPVFADWQQLLKEAGPLDLVGIATYTPAHAEITHACVEAGVRAIYCEKPVAPTIDGAEGMLKACDEAGALLVINHNLRFHPNMRRLRDLIAAGTLGPLTSVSAQWTTGRLGNVGTHMFDAIQMVTGLPIHAVSGTLDNSSKPDCRGGDFRDPGGWGVLRLGRELDGRGEGPSGDLMCVVDAADYGLTPFRLRFHGTQGWAECQGREVHVNLADGQQMTWAAEQDTAGASSMDRAVGEIVDWFDGKAFPYDATEAVRTLEAILAFHASHQHDAAWVSLPLSGNDRDLVLHSG
ncbi:MAG: Gfo/Idh/MocA family oxidoreductase [Gemmatimonadetes bacterium]|nr:Gfo/Idh/MocA family oxidoreductase [Gemmatimonadota bacterium]MBT6147605.1 Gfo/Idh/MocA family oxidoreductase [Gemmatimonadota bacterium]MBT7864246.1 Gfo/Idh/MocA family oxidoreductase [Gemmatimonadota bacterium]